MLEDTYIAGNPAFSGSDMLIVLTGCSGAGKSSLLNALAQRGYRVMPEAGRQIVKEQMLIGGDALPWKNAAQFVDLAASRAAWQYNSAKPDDRPVVFDRSVVDVISYLAYKGCKLPSHLKKMLKIYRYCPTVFVLPPWKEIFHSDDERQKDFEEATTEYDALMTAYNELGYKTVEIPKISISHRADFFEQFIQNPGHASDNG